VSDLFIMVSRPSAGKTLFAPIAAFVSSRRFLSATRLKIRCGKAHGAAASPLFAHRFWYHRVLTLDLTDAFD
jgi:hypothetical protein